jgi:hypothetical protein
MSKFWMTVEDPTYDDDGILVDEDAEWEDIDATVAEFEALQRGAELENFDPFETVNS